MDWARLVPLIGPTSRALGDFNGLLTAMPNADILLSPLATQATLIEVLEYEAGVRRNHSPDRINDIKEIQNYRQAIQHASKCLDNLPISGRLIKETHAILMQRVRGKDKNAGQYKSLSNAIGPYGCTAETAKFHPISPNKLADGMANWEKFIHSKQSDILVQLAIMHAEFESLHPFADGNGRLDRMLLPLFFYERNILSRPPFISANTLKPIAKNTTNASSPSPATSTGPAGANSSSKASKPKPKQIPKKPFPIRHPRPRLYVPSTHLSRRPIRPARENLPTHRPPNLEKKSETICSWKYCPHPADNPQSSSTEN